MRHLWTTAPQLLDELYEQTTSQGQWPAFLSRLARVFGSETATLRLTDLHDPLVYQSHTTGFHQATNQYYENQAVEQDPFRDALANAGLGKVLTSDQIISDQSFSKSHHYQFVFRPNGNFYAMGTQFDRHDGQGLHIGIHRPHRNGPYSTEEVALLEQFSPHFRRVARLSRLFVNLNQALEQSRAAMDQLAFGAWYMDAKLNIQWMNKTAEEVFASRSFGLELRGNHLAVNAPQPAQAIRKLAKRLVERKASSETVRLGATGASLLMTLATPTSRSRYHVTRSNGTGILCFLLDPSQPSLVNQRHLKTLYQLTPAELRLVSLLVQGLDVGEASAALEISPHTARTQLKSIMQKTGVNSQANLQRKLLISSRLLRTTHD